MTTLLELRRQVLLRLDKNDGKAIIAADQGINEAQKNIARVRDFDELMVLDKTHAVTIDGTSLYHLTSGWTLVRPKDIYSIRLMDTDNSRKLKYVPPRELDEVIPYTDMVGEGRPTWYTRRGMDVELFRIPDAVYTLYIFHSQWPVDLAADTDETPFLNLDDVISTLAADIATAILEEGIITDGWVSRAQQLLGSSLREEAVNPDRPIQAKPFDPCRGDIFDRTGASGEYWNNPFIKNQV